MKKTILSCSIIIITILFASCQTYRYVYTASPANNPYLAKKGDSKLAAYYSTSSGLSGTNLQASGVDIQAAYAFTDHFALASGYFSRKETDAFSNVFQLFDTSTVAYKRNLINFGAGYFTALEKDKKNYFSIFGGVDVGKFQITDNGFDKDSIGYNRFHNSDVLKFYVQPGLSFSPSPYIRFAVAYKLSFVNYSNVMTSYTKDEITYFNFDRIKNKTLLVPEPSFNFELGAPSIEWLKLAFNAAFASNNIQGSRTLRVRKVCFSVGLSMDVSKIAKKK